MEIYIADIHPSITYDDVMKHFSCFGQIKELKLISSYGFLVFYNDRDAERVLTKKHTIKNYDIYIEESRASRSGYNRRRKQEYVRQEKSCDYCDRCPTHGIKTREDNNKVNLITDTRLVINNIPRECAEEELKDFIESKGFQINFLRLTSQGNHGIIEFGSYDEREDALREFDNMDFKGNLLTTRRYIFKREEPKFKQYERKDYYPNEEQNRYENRGRRHDDRKDRGREIEEEEIYDDL